MSTYVNHGKTSVKRNSGWKSTLTERDCHTLRRIVSKIHTAAQVTAELNIHLEDHVSTKTVWRELHKSNIHNRAATAKPLITEKMGKRWCHDHKTWYQKTGNAHVIWSDELSFTLLPTSGRVYVWRTPKKAYNWECLVPTVEHGGGSVMILAAVSWYSVVPLLPFMAEWTG
jgi:hypothetical protein